MMMKVDAIGLMSGTSLDGLDVCYATFTHDEKWEFEIHKAETIPYPQTWEAKLKKAFYLSAEDLYALNSDYGFYLGETVNHFIDKHSIKNVDVIASHGHTIFHQPTRKFTTQIGDGRAIKLKTNRPTIYDFRSQDVLLGGNGAPLVPIGDHLLFSEFDACVNLGGFSNISFVKDDERIAFDICPVNILLNKWANELHLSYDDGGNIASKNTVDSELLQCWNNLDYYKNSGPKSLGIEWVHENILTGRNGSSPEVLIATVTEHAAQQIAKTINEYHFTKVLFTGGGAYNLHLMTRIKELTHAEIVLPKQDIINFKEALIFAFMGVLKLQGKINVLSSATGAKHDHSTGIIA